MQRKLVVLFGLILVSVFYTMPVLAQEIIQCVTETPTPPPATQPVTETATPTPPPLVTTEAPPVTTEAPPSETPEVTPTAEPSNTPVETATATATKEKKTQTPEVSRPPSVGECLLEGSGSWQRPAEYTANENSVISWDSVKNLFVFFGFKYENWPEGSQFEVEKNGEFFQRMTVSYNGGLPICSPVVETTPSPTPQPPLNTMPLNGEGIHWNSDCNGVHVRFENLSIEWVEVNGKRIEFVSNGGNLDIPLEPGSYDITIRFTSLTQEFLAEIPNCVQPVIQAFALRAMVYDRKNYELLDANVSGLDSERNDPLIDTKNIEIELIVFVLNGIQIMPSALDFSGSCAFYDFEDRSGNFWAIINDQWRVEIPEGYMPAPISSCYLNEDGTLHLVPGSYPEGIWRSLGGETLAFYQPDEDGKTPLFYWRQLHPVTPHANRVAIPSRWVELLDLNQS